MTTTRPVRTVSDLELDVRDFIRNRMILDGVTRSDLAAQLDLDKQSISRMLHGRVHITFNHAERMLAALGYQATITFDKIS